MKKFAAVFLFLQLFGFAAGYEHDLYQHSKPSPNLLFMVDTSGSMDYGVYDWKLDYKAWAKAVCTQRNYCLQDQLGYSYHYAADTVNESECRNFDAWEKYFYTDFHKNTTHRNKVYMMFNKNREVGYDEVNLIAKDPSDPRINWQNRDWYQGYDEYFSERNYTRGWIINPLWMEDVRKKLKEDPKLIESVRNNRSISSHAPMYRCKSDDLYPCSDPSQHEDIPTDDEGHVIFNQYAGMKTWDYCPYVSFSGLYLPYKMNGAPYDGCDTTTRKALYECAYDADGDGVVEQGECPRKLTPQQLAMELMEPGYAWTGYVYIADKSREPVFMTTGNWKNMQPFYNLYLLPEGTYSRKVPAWKSCTFSEEYANSEIVKDSYVLGKMKAKKTGSISREKSGGFQGYEGTDPFWWGGDAHEGRIVFTVVTDAYDERKNGKGITITKYRYKLAGQESMAWESIPEEQIYEYEKPIKTYRHYRGKSYYIPNNYAVDIVIEPHARNVVAIQALFEVFDLADTSGDFVMLRHEPHRRMNRRLDAVEYALTDLISEKSFEEEKLPWAVGFYPVSTGKDSSSYVSHGTFRSDLGANYVEQFNAIFSFFAEGGTPTGEGLLKSWDYYFRNQDRLWTCRDNHVVIISDGYPTWDLPREYMGHQKRYSDPKDTWLWPGTDSPYNYSSENRMESVSEFLYGPSLFYGRGKLYREGHDGDDPSKPEDGVNRGESIIVDAISFGYDVQRLKRLTEVSSDDPHGRRGQYYSVSNPDSLKMAVKQVVSAAMDSSPSISAAPAVSQNEDRFGNEAYLSMFAPRSPGHWWGTINKVCLQNEGEEGECMFKKNSDGKGNLIPNTEGRKELFSGLYYTRENVSVVEEGFKTGANAKLKGALKTGGGSGIRKIYYLEKAGEKIRKWPPSGVDERLDNWVNGYEYEKGGQRKVRDNPLGDFWHSSPMLLDKGERKYIAVGGNDGFLHIFDRESGNEVMSLIPSEEIYRRHLRGSFAVSSNKVELYGVDLTPCRIKNGEADFVSLGYRRGGKGYSFIKTGNLWQESIEGAEVVRWRDGFGQAWGNPRLHRNGTDSYIVAPVGYDPFFDRNDQDPFQYHGFPSAVYWGMIGSTVPEESALTGIKSKEGAAYPVTGDIHPFNTDAKTKYDKSPLEYPVDEQGNPVDSNGFYYVDLMGSLFYSQIKDGGPKSAMRVFDITDLTMQREQKVKNRELLKVFGSAVPVMKERENNGNKAKKREVWVFYGTGDISRTAK